MRIRLTWVREDCGNGKTCPTVSSVTPRGTRIVVGKKITDPELLAEVRDLADDEYVVEIFPSLGSPVVTVLLDEAGLDDYTDRFEFEAFRHEVRDQYDVPSDGDIRVLDLVEQDPPVGLVGEEFWLLDRSRAVVMCYDDAGRFRHGQIAEGADAGLRRE